MNQFVEYQPTYGSVCRTFTWPGSNFCGVYTWNGWLRLYDLTRREFIQEFKIYDTVGMTAAVSADDAYLYFGTYYAWGLGCFEISSRKRIWRRGDLKGFHGLSFSHKDGCLYAEVERGSALKIDGRTGETVTKLKRVNEVHASPYGDYILACEPKSICVRDTSGQTLWKWPREGFAMHSVAWSPRTIALVEAVDLLDLQEKFGTRVYDLRTGDLLWRKPTKETSPRGIMFRPEGEYVAIEGKKGETGIVRFSEETGAITRHQVPVDDMKCKACGRGMIGCNICMHGRMVFAIDEYTYETRLYPLNDNPTDSPK